MRREADKGEAEADDRVDEDLEEEREVGHHALDDDHEHADLVHHRAEDHHLHREHDEHHVRERDGVELVEQDRQPELPRVVLERVGLRREQRVAAAERRGGRRRRRHRDELHVLGPDGARDQAREHREDQKVVEDERDAHKGDGVARRLHARHEALVALVKGVAERKGVEEHLEHVDRRHRVHLDQLVLGVQPEQRAHVQQHQQRVAHRAHRHLDHRHLVKVVHVVVRLARRQPLVGAPPLGALVALDAARRAEDLLEVALDALELLLLGGRAALRLQLLLEVALDEDEAPRRRGDRLEARLLLRLRLDDRRALAVAPGEQVRVDERAERVEGHLEHVGLRLEHDRRALEAAAPPALHERLAVLVREERLHLEAHRHVEHRRARADALPPRAHRRREYRERVLLRLDRGEHPGRPALEHDRDVLEHGAPQPDDAQRRERARERRADEREPDRIAAALPPEEDVRAVALQD